MKYIIYYHLSGRLDENTFFYPRTPSEMCLSTENTTIKRICIGKRILDCIYGINDIEISDVFNVHAFIIKDGDCVVNWKSLSRMVPDSAWSHECWLLNPKQSFHIGKIKILKCKFEQYRSKFDSPLGVPTNIRWKWLERKKLDINACIDEEEDIFDKSEK